MHVLLNDVYSVIYKEERMFIHKKDISIHLDISIRLFMFDLLDIPQKITMTVHI